MDESIDRDDGELLLGGGDVGDFFAELLVIFGGGITTMVFGDTEADGAESGEGTRGRTAAGRATTRWRRWRGTTGWRRWRAITTELGVRGEAARVEGIIGGREGFVGSWRRRWDESTGASTGVKGITATVGLAGRRERGCLCVR
jgi:hypothetical protein